MLVTMTTASRIGIINGKYRNGMDTPREGVVKPKRSRNRFGTSDQTNLANQFRLEAVYILHETKMVKTEAQ